MHRESATFALREAITRYNVTTRWLVWCDGLHDAMKAAGVYGSVEYPTALAISVQEAYTAVNRRPKNPSKTHKHRMYDAIYRAADLADVEVAPGSIRDLEGIKTTIALVTAALST